MSLPELRVGLWTLHLRAEDAVLAEACRASLHDLASATLAPILAALAPGDDEILVLDRLALLPLALGPKDNSAALRTHVADAVRGALPPAYRHFVNRQAALVAFATAAAQGVADEVWLWRALDFLAPAQCVAAMPERATRLIAEAGAEALPLLLRLAATGSGSDPGALAELWPLLSTASVVALADAVAPHVSAAGLGVQHRPAVRVARALLQAAAPAFLTLPTTANPERAIATARLALAAAGAVALPGARFASLLAGAACLYAAAPAPQSFDKTTSDDRFTPHADNAVRRDADPPIPQATRAPRPGQAHRGDPYKPEATMQHHSQRPDRTPLGRVPETPPVRLPTINGGLLFLLNLIPETALLSSRSACHGVAQPLVRLAVAVGVPLDDPATRAFAGLWPGRIPLDTDPSRPPPEPSPALGSTGRLIEDLQAALARRPSPGLALARIVRRPAHLTFAPAEIDLHLPLAGIDIDIRRAGLDASPGFLPWLGTIVRFHYDER